MADWIIVGLVVVGLAYIINRDRKKGSGTGGGRDDGTINRPK